MLNLLEAFCQISNSLEKRQLAVGAQLITVKLIGVCAFLSDQLVYSFYTAVCIKYCHLRIAVLYYKSRSSSSSKFDNREIVILKGLVNFVKS
ncbi:hypothetical protein T4D_787 [Trichinella pseudospiralis]|uniref:Uncharacterized protein n=1 Tax=Trichinella pseudospiralis TaxID=6337 RepID=A0A0V1F7C1_TRIPS|nr:hypothetical protein T4D_787 [Trichinella pseudospiralis]